MSDFLSFLKEIFFNKEAPQRIVNDLPIIWFTIIATKFAELLLTKNTDAVYIDVMGGIFFVIVSLIALTFIFLIYLFVWTRVHNK